MRLLRTESAQLGAMIRTPPGSPPDAMTTGDALSAPLLPSSTSRLPRRRSSNGFFYQAAAAGKPAEVNGGPHAPTVVYYEPSSGVEKHRLAELEIALSRLNTATHEKDVEIEALRQELDSVNQSLSTQLQRRTQQARAMRDEATATKAALVQSQRECDELRQQLAAVESALADAQNDFDDQLATLEAKLEDTERRLKHAKAAGKEARAEAAAQTARADVLARALEAHARAPPPPPPPPVAATAPPRQALVVLVTLPDGRAEDLVIGGDDDAAEATQAFIQRHQLRPNAASRLLAFTVREAENL